jgi:transcription elongation factor Elf1
MKDTKIIEWGDWQKYPTCPYCGYEHVNYEEFGEIYNITYCDACGRDFAYDVEVDVKFKTKKIEE